MDVEFQANISGKIRRKKTAVKMSYLYNLTGKRNRARAGFILSLMQDIDVVDECSRNLKNLRSNSKYIIERT